MSLYFFPFAMYKSVLNKRITMLGSVFQDSSHFRNTSTDAVHMPRLPSWVHWYICCIIYGSKPHYGQRLVVACPRWCRVFMVDKVLLIQFLIKFAIWTVVLSCAILNDVRSITFQSTMWVSFLSYQNWSSRRLEISYDIDWARLEKTVTPRMDTIGIP